MPARIIESATRDGFADALVRWGPDEKNHDPGPWQGDPLVQLFIRAQGKAGGICFHPDRPEDFGLHPGEAVGPCYVNLDRDGLDELIAVLKRARRKQFGQH